MGSEVIVIAGVLVLGGLVWLWHLTFSVDPRIRPHPFVLRWLEPRWERWDDLDWDQKMRIFRRRQVVNWVFVVLVMGVLVLLAMLAVRAAEPQSQPAAAAAMTLPVHGDPFAVAVTPDGRYALVTLTTTGDVALFSRPAYRLVRTVHIGANPLGLALTSGGRVALVTDSATSRGDGQLVALAVPSLAILGRTTVGYGPIEVAVAPDGRWAYVSNEYEHSVSVIAVPAAGKPWPPGPATIIPVDPYPVGLAVSPGGSQLYVACELGGLLVYSTAKDTLMRWVNSGSQTVRVVLGDGGRVAWVTVRGENELKAYSARTLAPLGQVRVGTQPVGLALLDAGAVAAVADSARFVQPALSSQVTFVSTAAVLAGRPAVLGTAPGGYFPRQFAVSPHGHQLLLTEFRSQILAVFDVGDLPKV